MGVVYLFYVYPKATSERDDVVRSGENDKFLHKFSDDKAHVSNSKATIVL